MRLRDRSIGFAAVVSLLLFSGCQVKKPTSVVDAVSTTVEFEGTPLVAPPRTANDVLAKLDLDLGRPPECAAEDPTSPEAEVRSTYESLPPFGRRAGESRGESKLRYVQRRARDEYFRGRASQAVKYQRWAIQGTDDYYKGQYLRLYLVLSNYYAAMGQVKEAKSAVRRSEHYQARYWNSNAPSEAQPRWLNEVEFVVAYSAGLVAESSGELREAEQRFQEALRLIRMPFWVEGYENEAEVLLALARVRMKSGELVGAEVAVRDALEELRYEGQPNMVAQSAIALAQMSEIVLVQGRTEDAALLARAALVRFGEAMVACHSLTLNLARLKLAEALGAAGDWEAALDQHRQIERDMARDPETYRSRFGYEAGRIEALLHAGEARAAIAVLDSVREIVSRRFGDEHYRTVEMDALRGVAHMMAGAPDSALRLFARSVPALIDRWADADGGALTAGPRRQRFQLVLESYLALLHEWDGSGSLSDAERVDRMFAVAGAARSSGVHGALAMSLARGAAGSAELADIARREQDARAQITALYATLSNLMAQPLATRSDASSQSLRRRIESLREARAALLAQIRSRFPEYWDLLSPQPLTVAQVQARLRPGEALVATYVARDRTYLWAIPHSGSVSYAAYDGGAVEMARRVAELRAPFDREIQVLADVQPFDVRAAHRMYADLLEPIRAGWSSARSLLFVNHDALRLLPPSVFVTREPAAVEDSRVLFDGYREVDWLVRTHAVSILPSVKSLASLRSLRAGVEGRRPFVGFGDPVFPGGARGGTPIGTRSALASSRPRALEIRAVPRTRGVDRAELASLPPLPDTGEEIRSIAATLGADPRSEVFTGERATERAVKTTRLADFRVVAFATHGLSPGDLNGLTEPALALTPPDQPAGSDDGLLTSGEILQLRLDADWVVLSACNTASAGVPGAEALSGLGRAFFYAQARALLVSNWAVETTSARTLTTDLFLRQAAEGEVSRAEALRQSMLSAIDGPGRVNPASGEAVFSYAHPLFWAPFTLIGDGGRGDRGGTPRSLKVSASALGSSLAVRALRHGRAHVTDPPPKSTVVDW